jgi:hypothetical protein
MEQLVIAIPLLRTLEAGGVPLVGHWATTGQCGTLPVVINAAWDD